MFNVGEYVVCPGHGVGQVQALESRIMMGAPKEFYVIKIIANEMNVLVPLTSTTGMRRLATVDELAEIYGILKNHDVPVDQSTWNRRHRDYTNKLKTGLLSDIADVLRQLYLLKTKKVLSFGEKKMLEQCLDLMSQEIALTKKISKKLVSDELISYFH